MKVQRGRGVCAKARHNFRILTVPRMSFSHKTLEPYFDTEYIFIPCRLLVVLDLNPSLQGLRVLRTCHKTNFRKRIDRLSPSRPYFQYTNIYLSHVYVRLLNCIFFLSRIKSELTYTLQFSIISIEAYKVLSHNRSYMGFNFFL